MYFLVHFKGQLCKTLSPYYCHIFFCFLWITTVIPSALSRSFNIALSQIVATPSTSHSLHSKSVMHVNHSCHAFTHSIFIRCVFWQRQVFVFGCVTLSPIFTPPSLLYASPYLIKPCSSLLCSHSVRKKRGEDSGWGKTWEKRGDGRRYTVEKEWGACVITEGEKRLERVLGTDEGKMTWWKDACKSTVIEGNEWRCFVRRDAEEKQNKGGRWMERE